jgi:hypothetical protein
MISELYLKRAASIRKDYIKIVSDIDSYEKVAKYLSDSISLRTKELESVLEKLNQNKYNNVDAVQQELQSIMVQTEDDVNKVDVSIDKLNSKIEKLKQDEINLYKEIKNVYYQLSDEEIREQVQTHLKKLNLS